MEREFKYRILTAEGKIKYAGTGNDSWFNLETAMQKVDYEKGEAVYEYSKNGEKLWEVL